MTDEQPMSRRAAREAEAGKSGGAKASRSSARAQDKTQVLSATDGSRPAKPTGFFARHPKAWLFSSLGVAFLLLGTGAVFAGAAVGSPKGKAVASGPVTPSFAPRAVPLEIPAATALRTCSIDALTKDSRLLTFEGSVINVTTGEQLFDRSATTAAPPASVLKVLTATAALAILGADYQMTTRVFEGSTPGSIVLVGGGDPTLSALPAGVESVYTGAPKISELAAQTLTAWNAAHPGEDITSVILDATYWNPADKWDSTWARSEQTTGYHSEVTALMVDGDRADPQKETSPRSTDPIGRAGAAFVAALNLGHPVDVSTGSALAGKPMLAQVKSQPLKVLIGQMLLNSDNTLAEMIARVASKDSGGGGTAASLASVIPAALTSYGMNPTGVTIRDGSGLSDQNLVPPVFAAELMAKIYTGGQGLDVIKNALPVAGKTGSLASRFAGANAAARGNVVAKTGWITTSRTLSGWVNAEDGSVLSFAFYALGPVKADAMDALDTVTTGVFRCGNNLSNN
ncbi:MAG: D-alanyl-D-alanine carboxypeptidase [Microbacteriaceae bacterium]|nr:D-alanyl-D-alanine carboxypeptidase [Microbacteriaceae bacterium]